MVLGPLRASGRRPAAVGAERARIAGPTPAARRVSMHRRRELHDRRGGDGRTRASRAHGRLFQRSIACREGARRLRGRRNGRCVDRRLGRRGAVLGISAPGVPSRARHRRRRRRFQLATIAAIADARRSRVRRAPARQLRSRATNRLPSDRRYREYGVASRRAQQDPRYACARVGRYARGHVGARGPRPWHVPVARQEHAAARARAAGRGGVGSASPASAFAAALEEFAAARWVDAHRDFTALRQAFPEDGPTAFYAALAAGYASEPPRNWNGAVAIAAK